ncbi:MAG: hypothetical protein L0Z49_07850 [Actinobacteria bacterium]|nr:hypothetical protein [Actinomycetota bacterium]
MRTETVGIGGRRLLAIMTATALVASLVLLVTMPARAHTPDVDHDCYGWSVDLKFYNTQGDNSVRIWIDESLVVDIADFGPNYADSGTWDPSSDHAITVVVVAWDDPTGSKGWSFVYEGSEVACVQPTTTSTLPPTTTTEPPTTTTTEPPTTTTTVPETTTTVPETTTTVPETTTTVPETTTTLPDRFVCDESGAIVTVGPNDEGYDEAFDTVEEAERDCTLVEGTVVTTTPSTTGAEELPFTGLDTGLMSGLAMVLLGIGAMLLTVTRRLEEH